MVDHIELRGVRTWYDECGTAPLLRCFTREEPGSTRAGRAKPRPS